VHENLGLSSALLPKNQIAANINDLIVFAGHGKGERNYTARPDKPLKGVRPVVKGGKLLGWTVPSLASEYRSHWIGGKQTG
jgi:hypothetical protein